MLPSIQALKWKSDWLFKENQKLKEENERLRKESARYLSNWIAAQDLAYNRMIQACLKK